MIDHQPRAGDVKPAPRWRVDPLPDGSLRVMRTDDARLEGWTTSLIMAVGFNGFVQAMIAGVLGFVPGIDPPDNPLATGMFLVLLLLFGAIGLAFAHSVVWDVLGHEEWLVSRHRMEFRWGWKSSAQRKSRSHTDAQGTLELQHREGDSDRDESWSLCLWCPNDLKNHSAVIETTSNGRAAQEMRELGATLSQTTGWPLRLPTAMSGEDSGR